MEQKKWLLQLKTVFTYLCLISIFFLPQKVNAAAPPEVVAPPAPPIEDEIIYREEQSLFVGDGEVGNRPIYFLTYDKLRTSKIYYKTLGFTISRCVVGEQTAHPSGEYIKVVLDTDYFPSEKFDRGGYVETHFELSEQYLISQIASKYPEWYAELSNVDDTIYLKFDSIMITINNETASGLIHEDGSYSKTVYDIGTPGGTPWNPALKKAYGWSDPDKIDTHFDKYLLYNLGKDAPDPMEPPIVDSNEYVGKIGKDKPDAVTWNESSKYNIGEGIPTSEEVKNSIDVDSFFGYALIGKRNATKIYRVPYQGSYDESFEWTDAYGYVHTTTYKKHVSGYKTVERKASFYYIMKSNWFDFTSAIVENGVYPADTIGYKGVNGKVPIDVMINGEKNPTSVMNWVASNAYHIRWAAYGGNTLQINGNSADEIHNKATGMAEDLIGYATVKNDYIKINGQVYMDNKEVSMKNGEPIKYKEIPNDAYGPETYTKTIEIPFDVANGVYATKLKMTYERRFPLDNAKWTNTKENNHIKAGFEQNEPIKVHTPIISPVTILNPETKTQLIKENSENIRYQLLLDGTYNFKFDAAMHNEIKGYGWSGDPSKFDKYVKFKQVKFPFEVKLDDVFYKPNEWITLANMRENTFYIPTYAMENEYYEILYRVAAENVFDENGVDHIDDTQEIANLNPNAYVALYKVPIQLSGRIYDFQAVGIYDKDVFKGVENRPEGQSWDIQEFAFCPTKQEKRTGIYNRLGGPSVRYTLDGTITNNWNPRNTLPFANGRSLVYEDMGTLAKGTTFSFSLKTMANLWSQSKDEIIITPTFRYVDNDGNVDENVAIYYHNDAGNLYVKYGSKKDKEYRHTVVLKEEPFRDSYKGEDLTYTVEKYKEWTGDTKFHENGYIWRETPSYCLSEILLPADVRLLTGKEEQLEENLSLEAPNISKMPVDTETYDRFKYSMQTWYGNYFIPSDLFVCDEDIDLVEYAKENYGLQGNEDFFKKDGYLIVNFDIKTKNEGKWHLQYNAGTLDMWDQEGSPKKVIVGDPEADDSMEIPIKSGDVAIVDLERSISDRYSPAIFMIN